MLTTTPHLRTRRPSPTTVEYTVSTSPSLTLPLRLLITLTFLVRLLIGCSLLLLLYSKFLLSSYSTPIRLYNDEQYTSNQTPSVWSFEYIFYLGFMISSSRVGGGFTYVAERMPLVVLLPGILGGLYGLTMRLHTTESLLVLRGLGIQTSTSSPTYLSSNTTRFIPTEKIQDILVNEAFRGFEVRYYLVVVVEGEESVVVVFPRLLPRRVIVEKVWRGARECLFERESVRKKSAGKNSDLEKLEDPGLG
jgi:phosphatidylinositol glycan class H protein